MGRRMGFGTQRVQEYMVALTYPKSRQELVDYPVQENAPDDVVNTLRKIDDRQYTSQAALFEAIEKVYQPLVA